MWTAAGWLCKIIKHMNIYIVYHSVTGNTHELAKAIAKGVEQKNGAHAFLRRIDGDEDRNLQSPESPFNHEELHGEADETFRREYQEVPAVSLEELKAADALVVGSPVYYGNISSKTKMFIEQLTPLWLDGLLTNKVGGAFTTSKTLHGGKEFSLISILTSLLAFSMIPVGLPFQSAYILSHGSIFGPTATGKPTKEDKSLAEFFGARIAEITFALAFGKKVEKI